MKETALSLADSYCSSCRKLIDTLRHHSPAHLAAGSMSSPAATQIIGALEIIMGRDGTDRGQRKLHQLRDNANYMRRRLTEMGCLVLGDYDSPVLVCYRQNQHFRAVFPPSSLVQPLAVASTAKAAYLSIFKRRSLSKNLPSDMLSSQISCNSSFARWSLQLDP